VQRQALLGEQTLKNNDLDLVIALDEAKRTQRSAHSASPWLVAAPHPPAWHDGGWRVGSVPAPPQVNPETAGAGERQTST